MSFPPDAMRCLIVLALLSAQLGAAPPDLWKTEPIGLDALPSRLAALDRALPGLPVAVRPAVAFQKTWLQIQAGVGEEVWLPELARVSKTTGGDSCAAGLRELARAWLSRLGMRQVDAALLKFYRRQVRYPDSLEQVIGDIPRGAQLDAWGEPWVYKPAAPLQLKLSKQRYQLGTARYPALSRFEEALKSAAALPSWRISSRLVGTSRVLELQSANGKTAALQEGGRLGEIGLLFIGEGWALFADTERLFTAGF